MKKISLLFLFFFTFSVRAKENPANGFIENKGQIHDQHYQPRHDVLFGNSFDNFSLFLKASGVEYQISKIEETVQFNSIRDIKITSPSQISFYRIDLNWLNCNVNCQTQGNYSDSAHFIYYNQLESKGSLDVRRSSEVLYKNLYDGIDLKWYIKNGKVKYDFIVAAGKDHRQIEIEIKGAKKIQLNNSGDMIISTPFGDIVEHAPVVYQLNKKLKSKWKIINNHVQFEIENVDKSLPIVIDPAIRLWGTYFGGPAEDVTFYNNIDQAGNLYLTGHTGSTSNIATVGSHQTTFGGNGGNFGDAFLAKYNASGVLQWCTYYGGNGNDFGSSVAIDGTGNVYFTGSTTATNSNVIATAGAHQTVFGGGTSFGDAFLVKFNSAGVRQWGTYYGGTGNDYGDGLSIDGAGNIIMTGVTETTLGSVITTMGAHQTTFGGGLNDGFVVKFSPSGTRIWGSYYGGSGDDYANVAVCDASNNIYFTGYTSSSNANSISTAISHQPIYGGGTYDGFIVSLDANGNRLWGTYYGGNGADYAVNVISNSNNLYIAGSSSSSMGTAIATSGVFQSTYGGGLSDCFLLKLNTSGVRQWATYYGGLGADEFGYCSISTSGELYLAGRTTSSSSNTLIASSCAYQSSYGGGSYDDFLAKLTNNGQRLWGTYYGGAGTEDSPCCVCDQFGNVYLSGPTTSQTGTVIASFGSYQAIYGGGSADSYIAKFDGCIPSSPLNTTPLQNMTICSGNNTVLGASLTCNPYWFNVPTGGTPIFSGNTFTTGSLVSNTTYFIEESSCGVAAPRTAVSITVQVCTYISESQTYANSILIYPNPSSDFIYIDSNGINSLQILNALGEIVKEFIPSNEKIVEIDISALSSGIYFVKGKSQERTFSVKILVQK